MIIVGLVMGVLVTLGAQESLYRWRRYRWARMTPSQRRDTLARALMRGDD